MLPKPSLPCTRVPSESAGRISGRDLCDGDMVVAFHSTRRRRFTRRFHVGIPKDGCQTEHFSSSEWKVPELPWRHLSPGLYQ